ncbi:hypothetical protein ACFLR1_05520 [Bacteroidota bacterium]
MSNKKESTKKKEWKKPEVKTLNHDLTMGGFLKNTAKEVASYYKTTS